MSTTIPTNDGTLETISIPAAETGPTSVAGLTMLASLALAARGRLRWDQGDRDLALADLDEALRLEPGNSEAAGLRDRIRGERAGAEQGAIDPLVRNEGVNLWSSYRAGYQVMARYPDTPDYDGDPIGGVHQHTPLGRSQAIEYAKYLCGDESSRDREMLHDGHLTGSDVFDAVVVEVRSLVREVHLERGRDENDGPPDEPCDP